MCGIAGILSLSKQDSAEMLRENVLRMTNAVVHRGPNDSGLWVDAQTGIAFGHRRLSIVDLSAEGHQPMHSASGRLVIIFNGEIYNFMELRRRLEGSGHKFRGHSDTEVLLCAVEEWGIQRALEECVGMFAFALWDVREGTLYLARDRVGEKPLYYGWCGSELIFGSELKSLRNFSRWDANVNRDALAVYFYLGYIPAPYSIYDGFKKVPPGTYLKFRTKDTKTRHFPDPVPYWSMRAAVEKGLQSPFVASDTEAIAELDRLLKLSIRQQMVADVPVGAFLSGGIDSSTIVALMQAQSSRPVRTFTIGFNDEEHNEAEHAAAIAKHLGTDHTELYVTPADALAVIPRLPSIYDEPFSDSSQIPTYLVSELARRHVTVSLSGDAGDELFGGYPRYAFTERIWRRLRPFPASLRAGAANLIRKVPVPVWNRSSGWLLRLRGKDLDAARIGDRLHKGATLLALESSDELYWTLNSHWKEPSQLVQGASTEGLDTVFASRQLHGGDLLNRMCYADAVTYLPDDILVKVDRASMAVSLESRVPLLDHHVVEFAWRLPREFKVRRNETKWILKQVLHQYVPRELVDRPKMGFGVPLGDWLQGPLREWSEELLSESRLKREGFLDPRPIRAKWEEHVQGRRRWHYYLWNVLMFQAWLEAEKQSSFALTLDE